MAIIAFWKKDSNGLLHCYKYFYVPRPILRQTKYARKQNKFNEEVPTSSRQLLMRSALNEIYFFFTDNDNSLSLGILNLEKSKTEVTVDRNSTVDKHCHSSKENVEMTYKIED